MQEPLGPFQEPTSTISLREYGDVLRRRRAIILQTFVIVLVAGVLVTLFTAPIYQAKARLRIEAPTFVINQASTDPLADLFRINQQYSLMTQVEMLQTAEIKRKVSEKLGTQSLPNMSIGGIEGTQIIEVTAEGDNPELVSNAPNTLLEVFRDDRKAENTEQLKQTLAFAKQNGDAARSNLDDLQKQLSRFKKKTNIIELESNQAQQMALVDGLQKSRMEAQSRYNVAQTRLAQVAARLRAPGMAATRQSGMTQFNDPRIVGADDQMVGLEVQLRALEADIEKEYLQDKSNSGNLPYRKLMAQKERLEKHRRELLTTLKKRAEVPNPLYVQLADEGIRLSTEVAASARQVADVDADLEEARKRLVNFPNWAQEYQRLQRRAKEEEAKFQYFQSKMGDLELRNTIKDKQEPLTIMQRAETPTTPIRPKKAQNIVFAGLLGLFFGLCLALLQELFDDRINSPEEAERVLKLPSLGHIPMIEEEGLRLIKDISTFSPLMESYRSLRTNINFAAVGNPVRSLVVTSSVPAEGKSTTVANLAMAMALDNKRVIIVDADLRRPSQSKLFKVDSTPGLTDILVGTHSIDEVMRPTSVENVTIIPAGSPPPNPAELLGSAAMGHLLATLEAQADVILFDSPPALAVADSVVLASRTNGVLLVVGYGETKKANTKKALEVLSRANANVLGTVLNRMDGPSSGYYYGKYYVPTTDRPSGSSGDRGSVTAAPTAERALPEADAPPASPRNEGENN